MTRRLRAAALSAALAFVLVPSAPAVAVHLSPMDPVMAGTSTTSTTQLYRVSTFVAGRPLRWNPCAAIHWRFRSTYAPSGGLTITEEAVARISRATGIRFVYDGATTATPTTAWLPSSVSTIRPVLIGWTDGSHSDLLRGQPSGVVGMTRTAYFGTTVNGSQVAATKAAVIALNRYGRLPLTGYLSWHTVILHELGHAMGLDHVLNTGEVMYPVLQRTHLDFQYGDLRGLYYLGRVAGCINMGF